MTAIRSALISVYHKDGLAPVIEKLKSHGVKIYSTGGTERFIRELQVPVEAVESLTEYPSILGGRVKTLHPKIFGGILSRRDHEGDAEQVATYDLPPIDLVVVDLYPFEETVAAGASEAEVVEQIDIGGISLIRAAAKNFSDVVVVPSRAFYPWLLEVLDRKEPVTTLEERRHLAAAAFDISSHYDMAIYGYMSAAQAVPSLKVSESNYLPLRYGENPHQPGRFYGDLEALFDQLHGKELSYNNLLDVDAAVQLMAEFQSGDPCFAILKHNNACGVAVRPTLVQAYRDALAGDPVSAFGGVLICNRALDVATAREINELFCEVVIAPNFADKALELLQSKKNRILLEQKAAELPGVSLRSALNGVLWQEVDSKSDRAADFTVVTEVSPTAAQQVDLEFASALAKHTRSNTIVLAKNRQLLGSGTGQTSRVDALKQAIAKAGAFGLSLEGAVMASDAFFHFPECGEIAHEAGIEAVVQPGGSVKDKLSIAYCNSKGMAMVFTGIRHFKH